MRQKATLLGRMLLVGVIVVLLTGTLGTVHAQDKKECAKKTTISTVVDRKFKENIILYGWSLPQKCSDPGQSLTFTCPEKRGRVRISRRVTNDVTIASGKIVSRLGPNDEYDVLSPRGKNLAKLMSAPGRLNGTIKNGDTVSIMLQPTGTSPELGSEQIEEGVLFVLGDGKQFMVGNMFIIPKNKDTMKLIRESLHYRNTRLVITVTRRRAA